MSAAAATAAVRPVGTRWWGITVTSPSSRQTTRTYHRCSGPPHRPPRQTLSAEPPSSLAASRPQYATATTAQQAAPGIITIIVPARLARRRRPRCETVRPRRTGCPAAITITIRTITPRRRHCCSSRSTVPPRRPAGRTCRSRNRPTARGYPRSRACSSSPIYVSWPPLSSPGVTNSACCP